MITLKRNQQKMKYSLQIGEVETYKTDESGNVITYTDADGRVYPLSTGTTKTAYSEPVDFVSNITNKLDEVLAKSFGIDDSTKYAQIVSKKGYLPLKVGSLIWKKSEVSYESSGGVTTPDKTSADYFVMGIADEGLNFDLFLLQRNV